MKRAKKIVALLLVLSLILIPYLTIQAQDTGTANSLVAHYKFDGNFNDSSGNSNNGTLIGDVTFVDGINSQGAKFAGGYVEVKHSDSLNLVNGFTMSAWTYRENTKEQLFSPILSKRGVVGKTSDAYVFLTNQDRIAVGAWANSSLGIFTSTNWVDVAKWSLLTVTADTQGMKFYIDGKLVENVPKAMTFPASNGVLDIGSRTTAFGSDYFKGVIDDLKIYNFTQTPNDVKAEYTAMSEGSGKYLLNKPLGLVGFYKFDESLNDSSGYNNTGEAVAAEDGLTYAEGVSGKGLTFDGASYIKVKDSDSLDMDQGLTCSVWLKIDPNTKLDGKFQPIIDKQDGNTFLWRDSPAYRISLGFDKPAFNFHRVGKDATTTDRVLFGKTVNTGKWCMLTVTTNGKETKMYIDGVLKETQGKGVFMPHSLGDLLIGTYTHLGKTEFFRGTMDELRLYNYGMDGKEVKALFSKRDTLTLTVNGPKLTKSAQMKVELKQYNYVAPIAEANTGTYIIVLNKPTDSFNTSDVTKEVTYSSSNEKVLTVSETGLLKATGKGKAVITVTYKGILVAEKAFKVK